LFPVPRCFRLCALWQSEQVTPAHILLCANDAHSHLFENLAVRVVEAAGRERPAVDVENVLP
jgi:hypothetical protein